MALLWCMRHLCAHRPCLQFWSSLQPVRDVLAASIQAVTEAAAPAGPERTPEEEEAAASQKRHCRMLLAAMAVMGDTAWASNFKSELLPQLRAQAQLVWQQGQLASSSAAVGDRTQHALQLRPCHCLLCTSVWGASEGRVHGRRCSVCAARFCSESCWDAVAHAHAHAGR